MRHAREQTASISPLAKTRVSRPQNEKMVTRLDKYADNMVFRFLRPAGYPGLTSIILDIEQVQDKSRRRHNAPTIERSQLQAVSGIQKFRLNKRKTRYMHGVYSIRVRRSMISSPVVLGFGRFFFGTAPMGLCPIRCHRAVLFHTHGIHLRYGTYGALPHTVPSCRAISYARHTYSDDIN